MPGDRASDEQRCVCRQRDEGCSPADLSTESDPGVPDGLLTGADFLAFLDLFSQGC